MTFLAPIFLAAGATVAGAIVLLHFLARRRPRPATLPTARFVPDRPARWPSRSPRPTDWLLLLLRVTAVVAISAAFAQPVRERERALTARVVVADRSRAVADERAMRDSTLAMLREGDILVPFDTSARDVVTGARDSARAFVRSSAPASLSAALVAASRAAIQLRDRADSIELVIVSPLAAESWDESTRALRARWAGRARIVAVPLATGDTSPRGIEVRAPSTDAVSAAAAPFAGPEARTRVIRSAFSRDDSSWAAAAGRVVVHWPRGAAGDSMRADAVVGEDVVLAAPLVRRQLAASPDARVIARFADGAAAIVERAHGGGCVREVAFDFPSAGDIALRESARRVARLVGAACERDAPLAAMSAARIDWLRGGGALLATSTMPRPSKQSSEATSWLLIAGALLLLLEVGVRQRAGAI